MAYFDLIESRIQEAIAAGAFDALAGAGQPLALGDDESLAGDDWLGFKVLRNGNLLPEWLELAREIERDELRLAEVDRRHAQFVAWSRADGDWERFASAIRASRRDYERLARALRRKQDEFNLKVPGHRLERPGIWIDYHLERLDARLQEAGAPASVRQHEPPEEIA